MRWGFRVDTRPEAGGGHVMRCLALARQMREPVRFFVDPGDLWHRVIAMHGFDCTAETGARSCNALVSAVGEVVDAALFDGYGFAEADFVAAGRKGPVVRIDDDGDCATGDLVVRPGLGAKADDRHVLAGPDYNLLAEEYAAARARGLAERPGRGRVERILVAFGARDSNNATALALDAIRRLDARPACTVVLGSRAPHRHDVEARVDALPGAALLIDAENMADLYLDADLAVGGGGVSLLERLCCGLPSVVVTLAPNQESNAREAERRGAASYLGPAEDVSVDALASGLAELISNREARAAMSRAGADLVDGRGAARVAAAMRALGKAKASGQ